MSGEEHARILVVDDEPYIREILSRWLTEEGYRCTQAPNAGAALEALRGDAYELLISDIRMPEMSGLDLLIKVREEFDDLAVIMVTAVDDRETAIRTLELGAFGYVIKPFDQNEVLISVANVVERRRLALVSRNYQHQLEEEVRDRTADIRVREEEISLRLVSAAEYRDEETGAHIRRMGQYAEVLASALGWSSDRVDEIRLAAPMHDIGKIGIPDSILLKPGKLTDDEFDTIKRHTTIGAGILTGSGIPLLQMAEEIAISHHEKWDGSGYPRGVTASEIPEAGRIVAVADVYDALVHDRVYRPAMPEEKALGIMREGRGQHFDETVFDCFLDILPQFRQIQERVADESGAT